MATVITGEWKQCLASDGIVGSDVGHRMLYAVYFITREASIGFVDNLIPDGTSFGFRDSCTV